MRPSLLVTSLTRYTVEKTSGVVASEVFFVSCKRSQKPLTNASQCGIIIAASVHKTHFSVQKPR
jgi:hypothetical protein